MGILLSRLRGKPSAKAVLEELQKEIDELEDYNRSTEQQQKHLIGSLILYSIILYIGFAAIFYLYYFPNNLRDQIIYSIPLLIFPAVIWLLKQLLHQYFVNKLRKNEEQLEHLKKKRRAVLDLAMETETYRVAKELIEKYDPEIQKKAVSGKFSNVELKRSAHEELRRRTAASQSFSAPSSNQQQLILSSVKSAIPPMPRPILPRERTYIDRLLDYLVGDGPSNRYALVCKQCQSHNGMALREEFEFLAFRCCYCFHWNPARKQRPAAPRLPLPPPPQSSQKDIEDQQNTEVHDALEIEEITEEIKQSEHHESSETESAECSQPESTSKTSNGESKQFDSEETKSDTAK